MCMYIIHITLDDLHGSSHISLTHLSVCGRVVLKHSCTYEADKINPTVG